MALAENMVRIGAGAFAGIINALGSRRIHKWILTNLDTKEKLEGQFGPEDLKKTPGGSTYSEHTSLNRDQPILQFVHGNADRLTFGITFFAKHQDDTDPETKIATLENWSRRDPKLLRPPIVAFTFGDGQIAMKSAVIESLGEIQYYDPPKERGGGIRGVKTQITLKAYTQFKLESKPTPLTRYHRAKTGDYFEYLAWFEYGNALLGDVVRKIHPDKLLLQEGDIVTLHSYESVRLETVKPTSIVFSGVTSSKESDQKTLRNEVFDRHSGDYYSGIVREA